MDKNTNNGHKVKIDVGETVALNITALHLELTRKDDGTFAVQLLSDAGENIPDRIFDAFSGETLFDMSTGGALVEMDEDEVADMLSECGDLKVDHLTYADELITDDAK